MWFNTIKGGTFEQENGVLLENKCYNNTIINNIFINLMRGIYLWTQCDNNIISGNNLFEDDGGTVFPYGIELNDNSERNIIINNTIRNHSYLGIFLHVSSDYNYIAGNKVWHNDGLLAKGNMGFFMSNSDNNTIIDNIFTNHSNYGILIQNNCDDNNFTDNTAANNSYRGAEVDDTTCTGNIFWLNKFFNNGLHAKDDSDPGDNQWDNGFIGNYWDNYTGIDANDDGLGDSYYSIAGIALANDTKPIWNDGDDIAPVISISAPNPNQIFGNTAPDFNILITDLNLHSTWYSIWNGSVLTTNKTFSYGVDTTIDQSFWDRVGNGTVLISFYVNDTNGNLNWTEVTVRKDINAPSITINSPTANELFGSTAPGFDVTITDPSGVYATWYTIDGGVINFTFSDSTGTIDETVWEAEGNGTVTLRICANDAYGNWNYIDIMIRKDIISPILTIINPVNNEIRGITERDFAFNIIQRNLDSMWYSIAGGQNHTFTLNGTFNQIDWETAWDSTSVGGVFTIFFFANDTAGNLIQVDIFIQPNKSTEKGISFGMFFLAISLISLISLVGILNKKVLRKQEN